MNKIILVGRLTADPELTIAKNSGTSICKFTLAVNRKYKKEGQPDADFFFIIQFGKSAEATATYMHKGSLISLSGSVQNRNYLNKDNKKVYITEILAEDVNFLDKKGDSVANDVTPAEGDSPF